MLQQTWVNHAGWMYVTSMHILMRSPASKRQPAVISPSGNAAWRQYFAGSQSLTFWWSKHRRLFLKKICFCLPICSCYPVVVTSCANNCSSVVVVVKGDGEEEDEHEEMPRILINRAYKTRYGFFLSNSFFLSPSSFVWSLSTAAWIYPLFSKTKEKQMKRIGFCFFFFQ